MGKLLVICLSLAGGTAYGQAPYLVEDIDSSLDPYAETKPTQLTRALDALWFAGDTYANDTELFRTDGTTAGTSLLMDLIVYGDHPLGPENLTAVEGRLFFTLRTQPPGFGDELWSTDGTVVGTVLARTVVGIQAPTAAGGLLFFVADDAGSPALWRSDGTAAGTLAIRPGVATELTSVGSTLYFAATDPANGKELWKSDGTAGGTLLVKDVWPGVDAGSPHRLTAVGGQVFFRASSPTPGPALWKSDGTDAGTVRVDDLVPGGAPSEVYLPTAFGGLLLFGERDGLWRTDSTAAGTVRLSSLSSVAMVAAGARAFVIGSTAATGVELWSTDGTTAGTTLVADLCPGACDGLPHPYPPMAALGAASVVFWRVNGSTFQLWRSDGSAAGTFAIGSFDSIEDLTSFGGAVFFAGANSSFHRELWRTDGTAAGTVRVTAPASGSSFPQSAVAAGGKMYFTADQPATGREVWASDGTSVGTSLLIDAEPGASTSSPQLGTAVGDHMLFTAASGLGTSGLWSTDGTTGGTERILGAFANFHPSSRIGDTAIFGAALEGEPGSREPWRSDGTAEGTALLRDIAPGGAGSYPEFLAAGTDRLFFSVPNYLCGDCNDLWRTDGTTEGTAFVVHGPVYWGAVLRETLFFTRFTPSTGEELWVSDGTAQGTRLVKDIVPGIGSPFARFHTAAGDLVYFVAYSPGGSALWRSDGTDAGTYALREFSGPGTVSFFNPSNLTERGGLLYFVADDGVHGRELWRSDGSVPGTTLVEDIWPGPGSSLATATFTIPFVKAAGRLLLAAYRPETGIELWQSDGTAGSAVPLAEIAPGPASSAPLLFGAAGARAYLRADDGTHGAELWGLDLPPALAAEDVAVTEGDTSATSAVFTVRLSKPSAVAVTVAFATADRSATAGGDYTATAGALTFPPGSTASQTVTVPVLGDLADEPDESFVLTLSAAVGADIADSEATAIVRDDDFVRLAIADVAVSEGTGGTVQTQLVVSAVTADGGPLATAKSVEYESRDLTAAAPFDYVGGSGSMTFAAGLPSGSTGTVGIVVTADALDEPNETFEVRLTPSSDVVIDRAVGTGTILDDDGTSAAATRELTPGVSHRGTLAAAPAAVRDWYVTQQAPSASYEVVVDDASGDVAPVVLRRWSTAGTLVLQTGVATGTGGSVALRWENTEGTAIAGQHVSVESGGCGADCGADDTYRIRLRETTLSIPRFNSADNQATRVVLQNLSAGTVNGRLWRWSASGYALGVPLPFTLPPHGMAVLDPADGFGTGSGSLTVTHDGGYGDLAGKAVSADAGAGFSFDTPVQNRRY